MKNKLILLSTILLFSCGARKVEKSKTDETTKKEVVDNSKTETKIYTNTKVIDCTDIDEITIVPFDNNQPILVNGRIYKNVVLKQKKVKANKVVDQIKKVAKNEQKAIKTNAIAKKSAEVKQVYKKQFNYLSLWWLYLLIIAMVYFGYKYRKELFL